MINTIPATVTSIQQCDSLHLIQCQSKEHKLTMMSLELSEKVKKGSNIHLGIKPTNIILAKEYPQKTSCENIFHADIISIQKGKLLCIVKLSFEANTLEAIITKQAQEWLSLEEEDSVLLLIQANDIYIREIQDV